VKAVFVGATKGMGRALARRMAERGERVFLLGRDLVDLARSAEDLELRGAPTPVGFAHVDLARPDDFEAALAQADAGLEGFDTVVVTGGLFASQDELEKDPALLETLLAVDFANTVLFCEAARKRLVARGGGTLCVFSSVAGDRGRSPVVLYGAAKAGLSHYLEGLDHRFRRDGLRTVCVKPGFVKTGMTAQLAPPPFAGEADPVAARVLRAIDRGWPVVYAPGTWRWIMGVIRWLPRGVMRRLAF
jgi:NAD(P)-dependent dehydrogenase (short-subunit alcohol dehydrogenase family)